MHFTSVSVTVTVSQEDFVSEGYRFNISFFFCRKVHVTSVSVTVTVSQEGFHMRRVSFLYFLGVHFTSVSVTVTVSQEDFRVRRVSVFYIFSFSLGRYISLPFPSLSQCHKNVSA